MCWSNSKGLSLVVVVCGILTYCSFTEKDRITRDGSNSRGSLHTTRQKREEYKSVGDVAAVSGEGGRIMCV